MENCKYCDICKRYWLDVFESSHKKIHKYIFHKGKRIYEEKILENMERVSETL